MSIPTVVVCKEETTRETLEVGTRIKFLKELSSAPCEEHPGCLYANKDEEGEITKIGGCWEGFWVKRDAWKEPFGCERENFEVIKQVQ